MFIYNVTIKLDHDIHSDWLKWMKEKHIPDVLKSEKFQSHRLCRLIEPADKDGFTYAIQYFASDIKKLTDYQEKHAPPLQREHTARYKDKFVAFRTILKVID